MKQRMGMGFMPPTQSEFNDFGALVCGKFWDTWKPAMNPACDEEDDRFIQQKLVKVFRKRKPTPGQLQREQLLIAANRARATELFQRNNLVIEMYTNGYTTAAIMDRHRLTSGEVSHIIYTNGAIDE